MSSVSLKTSNRRKRSREGTKKRKKMSFNYERVIIKMQEGKTAEHFEAKFRDLLADFDTRVDDPQFAEKRQKLQELYTASVSYKNNLLQLRVQIETMKTQALKYNHAFLVSGYNSEDYETAVKEN